MTLMDFIQTEIEAGNVFDVDEFGSKLENIQYVDGKLIEPEEFKDYLNHDLKQATIHHYYGRYTYFMWYGISVMYKDFTQEKSE